MPSMLKSGYFYKGVRLVLGGRPDLSNSDAVRAELLSVCHEPARRQTEKENYRKLYLRQKNIHFLH